MSIESSCGVRVELHQQGMYGGGHRNWTDGQMAGPDVLTSRHSEVSPLNRGAAFILPFSEPWRRVLDKMVLGSTVWLEITIKSQLGLELIILLPHPLEC